VVDVVRATFVAFVAVVALVADVAVAALPEMEMPHVPVAPVPSFAGASFAISAFTNAVVAICVVFVPTAAVGARGVPVKVGEAEKTTEPVPVSPVIAAAKLAEDGVARNVATLVPRPDTPVAMGSPVQFVSVPDVGVPKTGVTSVGDVAKTSAPVPVSSVTAVLRLAEDGVARNAATLEPRPETPVEIGNPVQFVSVPDAGVPSVGVVSTGEASVLLLSV
jgi:hypothetical protein